MVTSDEMVSRCLGPLEKEIAELGEKEKALRNKREAKEETLERIEKEAFKLKEYFDEMMELSDSQLRIHNTNVPYTQSIYSFLDMVGSYHKYFSNNPHFSSDPVCQKLAQAHYHGGAAYTDRGWYILELALRIMNRTITEKQYNEALALTTDQIIYGKDLEFFGNPDGKRKNKRVSAHT